MDAVGLTVLTKEIEADCAVIRDAATLRVMESKIAKSGERWLVEATQRLSPEERLNAFLVHCRLVMELHEAGREIRARLFRAP